MNSSAAAPNLEALRQIPRVQLVEPNGLEHFISEFVDTLDLDALGFEDSRRPNWRAPHGSSKLLKVFLLAWVLRVQGLRAMAKACRWDLRFLYLCDCDPPKRSTIGRFWRANNAMFQRVFVLLVQCAKDAELIGMDLHALDGTKVRAASSMHSGVHREAAKKN
jgi:transposase